MYEVLIAGDIASLQDANSVVCSVSDVSSVLGWLRAQSGGRKCLRDGVACFDDVLELRSIDHEGSAELAAKLDRASDDSGDARRRAIETLIRCVCTEIPPPSRLPRPFSWSREEEKARWHIPHTRDFEDLAWALVASCDDEIPVNAGLTATQDAFVCSFSSGAELRVEYSQGVATLSSYDGDHFKSQRLWDVPLVAEQPTAGAAWATMIVDELVRCGVDRFVVCPGSRSTPLALAATRHPCARKSLIVIHDERAAAFYGLGHARASDGAVAAVITTSGTAVSNLLPAAAEASEDGVPLVLLTADRPPEVRGVGADQALSSQKSLLEGLGPLAAKWSRDLGPADDRLAGLGELAEFSRGIYAAKAKRIPVHFNLAFRENLAPRKGPVRGSSIGARGFGHADDAHPARSADWDRACVRGSKFIRWESGYRPFVCESASHDPPSFTEEMWQLIETANFGAIVFGRLPESEKERAAAQWLVREVLPHWLVVHRDVQSGLVGLIEDEALLRPGIVLSDPLVNQGLGIPDVVLQIGASLMLPRGVRAWLDAAFDNGAEKIVAATTLDNHETRVDDDGATSYRFRGTVESFTYILSRRLRAIPPLSHRRRNHFFLTGAISQAADNGIRRAVEDTVVLTEPMVANLATTACAERGARLFVSNSMAVRDVDAYGVPVSTTAANRGLAGIDGVVASAAGYASNGESPALLLIGDQSFLHDLSSLRILSDSPALRVVVVNNRGGAIFSFLPVAEEKVEDPDETVDQATEFEPLFGAPQSVDFGQMAAAFNISYVRCSTREALLAALIDDSIQLVEAAIGTTRSENVLVHRLVNAQAAKSVRAALVGNDSHVGAVSLAWSRRIDNFCAKRKRATLVVLHGLFGSRVDLDDTLRLGDLYRDRDVISFDLNGHGESGPHGDTLSQEAILFSFEAHVAAMFAALDRLNVTTFDILGYSLGARVSLKMKSIAPDRVRRVVAVSPNLEGRDSMSDADRCQRESTDDAIAQTVLQLSSRDEWRNFFDQKWYSASAKVGMWATLRTKQDVFDRLLEQRLDASPRPEAIAASIRGAGLAKSPSLWNAADDADVLYIYGDSDNRCSAFAQRLRDSYKCSVTSIPGAGHALPCESALELGEAARLFLEAGEGGVSEEIQPDEMMIDRVQIQVFDLPRRTKPVARWIRSPSEKAKAAADDEHDDEEGTPPPLRGVLISLASIGSGPVPIYGLGEASPCGGVHEESVESVLEELKKCSIALRGSKVSMEKISRLDGALTEWIDDICNGKISSTARFALETAILQLVSKSRLGSLYASALGREARSHVHIASLIGDDALPSRVASRVVKIKAGTSSPKDDARRVSELVDATNEGDIRIRVDANRAWSSEEYSVFEKALSPTVRAAIDFIEEPSKAPVQATLPLARDESICERVGAKSLFWCDSWDDASTIVLKPAVLGVEVTMRICREALFRNKSVVMSSCFESGVGLSHIACMAATLDVAHGLGTYAWLSRDILHPSFETLLENSGSTHHEDLVVDLALSEAALASAATASFIES